MLYSALCLLTTVLCRVVNHQDDGKPFDVVMLCLLPCVANIFFYENHKRSYVDYPTCTVPAVRPVHMIQDNNTYVKFILYHDVCMFIIYHVITM